MKFKLLAAAATVSFLVTGAAFAQDVPATQAGGGNVEQRAAAIVAKMTLEEKAAQLGNVAPAIPRLGVPAYNWWNEGLHGVARAGFATVFPQAIGMAATWDVPLMGQAADTISTEFQIGRAHV